MEIIHIFKLTYINNVLSNGDKVSGVNRIGV